MARITNNLLVRGARGNVGKQFVYKKRGKTTHITQMPEVNKNLVATDEQVKVRDLFAAASLYAKGAISSPDLKKQYQKKVTAGNTAYNMAFRDYLKAPTVKSIDAENYTGTPGSLIVVSAKDDFRVVSVTVRISTAAGVLVEVGNAILDTIDLNKWIYTATQTNASLAGSIVTATAQDLPANKAMLDITI